MGLEHLGGGRARGRRGDARHRRRVPGRRWASRDWVLALGHVGVFNGAGGRARRSTPTRLERLRERVEAKDGAGVRERCWRRAAPPARPRTRWRGSTPLAGDVAVLDEAAARVARRCPAAAQALGELRAIVDALVAAGLGARLAIDLGEVRGLDYYTGLVFRVVRARPRASRWAAAAATTRCSRASAGRCRRSASCSASTAWRCCSSARARAGRRPAPPPRTSRPPTSREGLHARPRAARARAAASGSAEARAMSLTVALSKGKLLAGTEALFRARGPAVPRRRGPPARGRDWTGCASCS